MQQCRFSPAGCLNSELKQPVTGRPVAGRGGPGVRTPPEPLRVTFLNRPDPLSFFIGGGGGKLVQQLMWRPSYQSV